MSEDVYEGCASLYSQEDISDLCEAFSFGDENLNALCVENYENVQEIGLESFEGIIDEVHDLAAGDVENTERLTTTTGYSLERDAFISLDEGVSVGLKEKAFVLNDNEFFGGTYFDCRYILLDGDNVCDNPKYSSSVLFSHNLHGDQSLEGFLSGKIEFVRNIQYVVEEECFDVFYGAELNIKRTGMESFSGNASVGYESLLYAETDLIDAVDTATDVIMNYQY